MTVAEHLLPDLISDGQVAALKGDALHLLEQCGNVLLSVNLERPGRIGKNLMFTHFHSSRM